MSAGSPAANDRSQNQTVIFAKYLSMRSTALVIQDWLQDPIASIHVCFIRHAHWLVKYCSCRMRFKFLSWADKRHQSALHAFCDADPEIKQIAGMSRPISDVLIPGLPGFSLCCNVWPGFAVLLQGLSPGLHCNHFHQYNSRNREWNTDVLHLVVHGWSCVSCDCWEVHITVHPCWNHQIWMQRELLQGYGQAQRVPHVKFWIRNQLCIQNNNDQYWNNPRTN